MRILFVAFPESIHAARWINQITDQGWDVHLFPSHNGPLHPDFRNITIYGFASFRPKGLHASIRWQQLWPPMRGTSRMGILMSRFKPDWVERSAWLARVIRRIEPDIIHSLEFQQAGYLTHAARAGLGMQFPTWIVSAWGSDIFLFGRMSAHVEMIKAVLGECDYLWCDCNRDIPLVRSLGFKGGALPIVPVAGGLDTERLKRLRSPGRTSERRVIALKGYQNWAGRALVGLRAIELCADVLKNYRILVYLGSPDVALAAELLSCSTGIATEMVPPSPHEDILRLQANARISIGLSISDGLPLSALEAMAMGAFPIQSNTSCLGEWLHDGESALLVSAEDPDRVATAIRRAVWDDELVDRAAEINMRIILERLDHSVIQPEVVRTYEKIATGRGLPH